MRTLADAIRGGDPGAVRQAASSALPTRPDNLVERPWGGRRLAAFKGLAAETEERDVRIGESFEVAADPTDEEAHAHPSRVLLPDRSELALPALLAAGGEEVLGREFVERHGRRFPLLPKFLDVHEQLSVQAHPAGNPEAYVVVAAEEGATLALGFRRDVDRGSLRRDLVQARRAQERLLELVRGGAVPPGIVADLAASVLPHVRSAADRREVEDIVALLERTSTELLSSMNALPVRAGDVIDNSAPDTRTHIPTAELHALGNPERREVLLLEVRKPGPSLRVWDHARFPPRPLLIEAGLAAASARATTVDDFRAERRPVAGRPGVEVSVVCPYYALAHLEPPEAGDGALRLPPDGDVRTLHVMRGEVMLTSSGTDRTVHLRRGASALLPVQVPSIQVTAARLGAEVLLVTVP